LAVGVGTALLAVLGAGGILAASAEAAGPTNHIFLSYHGMPTYTWTVRLYDNSGKEMYHDHQTCIGGCKRSFPFDPAVTGSAYISVNSGTYNNSWYFGSTDGAGHDHCILVKAGGKSVSTGDETRGCNSK
jgi:hypothetical protein